MISVHCLRASGVNPLAARMVPNTRMMPIVVVASTGRARVVCTDPLYEARLTTWADASSDSYENQRPIIHCHSV